MSVSSLSTIIVGVSLLGVIILGDSAQEHKQHATIGVLVDLHEGVGDLGNVPGSPRVLCGSLNLRAFQQLAAVRWATETINNKSWPNEFALDITVHDTCGESGIALSETLQLTKWAKDNLETPLIGVIVIGSRNNERIIDKPLETLNKENISVVVTSSRAAELLLSRHMNVFTTAPDISSVTEAIVTLLHELDTQSVAVITSCTRAVRQFEKFALAKSLPAKHFLVLQKDSLLISDAILKFLLGNAGTAETIVLLLESAELERLLRDKAHLSELQGLAREKSWILGSVGMEPELAKEWSLRFNTNLLLMQPHVSTNPEFESYFLNNVKEAVIRDEASDETREYVQRIYQCQWTNSQAPGKVSSYPPCGSLHRSSLAENFHPDSGVGFIVSAVSAFSAALRLAQLETCGGEEGTCDNSKLSYGVFQALQKLNFPIGVSDDGIAGMMEDETIAGSHELEGTRGRINHQGKLVSRKYDLLFVQPHEPTTRVGQFSTQEGLRLDGTLNSPHPHQQQEERSSSLNPSSKVYMSPENGLGSIEESPSFTSISTSTSVSRRAGKTTKARGRGSPRGNSSKDTSSAISSAQSSEPSPWVESYSASEVNMRLLSPEIYISRVWAMIVVAVGITGVFLGLYILVYVLLRMCDGTLNGNQGLGVSLLLCLMLLFSSVVLFVLPPGPLLCSLRVFLPSTSGVLVFGILLLKVMQLRSLVTLGLGGSISSLNQAVTLAFIVAAQIAINLQWSLSPEANLDLSPIHRGTRAVLYNDCDHSHKTYFLLHSYLGLLILFVFLYGCSALRIRRNYNEARWVTLSALFSLPICLAWAMIVYFGPREYQEPAASISFLSIATIVLFSIFIPKLSQISRQSSWVQRKLMLQPHQVRAPLGYHAERPPGYPGSISTIFTTLSDRGGSRHGQGTLQSQKTGRITRYPSSNSSPPPPPPPMPSSTSNKSVTYSPRLLTTNLYQSSIQTSLGRNGSLKAPLYDPGRGIYP